MFNFITKLIQKNNTFFLNTFLVFFLLIFLFAIKVNPNFLLVESYWSTSVKQASENFEYRKRKLYSNYEILENFPLLIKDISKNDYSNRTFTKNYFSYVNNYIFLEKKNEVLKKNQKNFISNQVFAIQDADFATLKTQGRLDEKKIMTDYINKMSKNTKENYLFNTIQAIYDSELTRIIVDAKKKFDEQYNSLLKEKKELEFLFPDLLRINEEKNILNLKDNFQFILRLDKIKEISNFDFSIETEKIKKILNNNSNQNYDFYKNQDSLILKLYTNILMKKIYLEQFNFNKSIDFYNLENYENNKDYVYLEFNKKLKILFNSKKNTLNMYKLILPDVKINYIYKNYFGYILFLSIFISIIISLLILLLKELKINFRLFK